MKQRIRIDLGQKVTSAREKERLERKSKRWNEVNKNNKNNSEYNNLQNPYVKAISPCHDHYGEPDETVELLEERLRNFEFGNFPGYLNYRNKAGSIDVARKQTQEADQPEQSQLDVQEAGKGDRPKERPIGGESGWNRPFDDDELQKDERMCHLREEWFKGRNVLDIGCNRGFITYSIARLYEPRFIVGVDIDPKIIMMANRDLHLYLELSLIGRRRDDKLRLLQQILLCPEGEAGDNEGESERAGRHPGMRQNRLGPKIAHQGESTRVEGMIQSGPSSTARRSTREERRGVVVDDESKLVDDVTAPTVRGPDSLTSTAQTSTSTHTRGATAGAAKTRDDTSRQHECRADNDFPLSSYIARGPLATPSLLLMKRAEEPRPCAHQFQSHDDNDAQSQSFPNNLLFVEHNYVPASDRLVGKQVPYFDTILCLSVTKWVHLNYRDEGLKRFFKRVYNHLHEGGLFVLEAQPFDNYARRKRTSVRLRTNFYGIQFRPEQFDAYLLSEECGFKEIIYESRTSHLCSGFQRPIKVFLK